MLLEGQSALVTGAGRGIGKAIEPAFARQGSDIAAVARTSAEVEATAREVRGLGRKTVALTCDVADPKAVPAMAEATLAAESMPHRDRADWLTPEDVAHTALYLATQSARAATDEVLVRRFDSVPIGG